MLQFLIATSTKSKEKDAKVDIEISQIPFLMKVQMQLFHTKCGSFF